MRTNDLLPASGFGQRMSRNRGKILKLSMSLALQINAQITPPRYSGFRGHKDTAQKERKGECREMRRQALLLLTSMTLVLIIASGTAMAETKNGLIYHGCNSFSASICSTDPTATNPQPTTVLANYGDLFDISRDRTTLVYQNSGFSNQDLGPFFTAPLSDAPMDWQGKVVEITNLSDSLVDMTMPTFSPDGKTIYFRGNHVIDPPEGADPRLYDVYAIYSVPTEGGEATRIPIDWSNSDGTPRNIGTFALSHDGSTLALGVGSGILTVPISGGVPTKVADRSCGGAHYPSFSPDDQMIVYTDYISSGDNCSGTVHLTVYTTPVNNNGTSPGTPLFPEDATDTNIYDSKRWPTYSPDGKYITFANWLTNSTDYLSTAPATGGAIKKITPCSFCVPVWIEKLPDTTITSSPSFTSSPTVSFAFSSDESDATFECRLDEGSFEDCSSPKQYTNISYGSHTFEVRAVNGSGIADFTPAKYSWTVDNVPETTIDSGPSGYVRSTSASFSFSSPPESGTTRFECKRDTATSFTTCRSPQNYSSLSQGNHTFQVRAINTAGKPDPYPASRSWFVDTVAPKGTIAINGKDTSTRSQSVTLYLSASDPSPGSGVDSMRFRNENTNMWSEWFPYSGTYDSWLLSNGAGTKTVYAQFQDRAGNVSATAYDKIKYAP
jgi:hypothetical protein